MQRWTIVGALVMLYSLAPLPCRAAADLCPFCALESEPTLMQRYKDSRLVIHGQFINQGNGVEFAIEKVLKNNDAIKGKNVIPLKIALQPKTKFILFCDVINGAVDPVGAVEVPPGSKLLGYLADSLKHIDAPVAKRLRHAFDFLANADLAISTDAYREFAKADYNDYKDMAKSLPAETLAKWLKDPATPEHHLPLYASLLGHCGDPKVHGDFLHQLLDDSEKRQLTGLEGFMAGYTMLQPKDGSQYLMKIAKNNDPNQFNFRYSVIVTLRFFHDYRLDVLSKEQIILAMDQMLDLPDVSDFAINDLCEWKVWDKTDRVLALFNKANYDIPIIDRAILRFALCSPTPRAAAFVAEQRKRDPVWVSDMEEILRAGEAILNGAPKK